MREIRTADQQVAGSGGARRFMRRAGNAGKTLSRVSAWLTTAAVCGAMGMAQAQAQAHKAALPAAQLTIEPENIVTPVSPMLYGMMTEEINHSYDGGLYAEMLMNRTFRGSWEGVSQWYLMRNGEAAAGMKIDRDSGPSKALPYSLKVTVDSASPGNEAGVTNSGFWGIALKPHTTYNGSFYGEFDDASIGPVKAQLISDDTGAVLASADVQVHGGGWSQYTFALTTGAITPSTTNHFALSVAHAGTFHLQLASLMPPTFHNRPNGNRPDLMEKMAGLHPHFLRLPGGNYLEGDRLQDWYNWKETIGPLVDRPGHQAPWSYWSTDGLGLLEFLEWCEDLKIEPVLAVYAGYSLRQQHVNPGKDLDPYVQAAVDEVQYVTGDTSTKWGAERAKDGHPAPFPLHYIEIGNEDFFDRSGSYPERFAQFASALRKQYPQYKLIATTPITEKHEDEQPDLIDDHYYKSPADMMDMVHHYDNAPRNGPKIFVGEWATRSGTPTPNFGDALGDAAWMTSMERNSDLIVMASYAPLLVNVNPGAMQWPTDLIGFDAEKSYASPSYWAQSLFGGHIGDGTPKSALIGGGKYFFYSATVDSKTHVLHLKLVNASSESQPLTVDLNGVKGSHAAHVYTLHAASYQATNSITEPNVIHPVESRLQLSMEKWNHAVPAFTIEVIDIPLR
ncbi:MAG TPA: alpha-L-arabinofuranosidase C-terminal domain-containing protein [Acidobacteriaceae bacterium]|nr:alpha-L-arabinofuranosidase C-terminal domain-containing protein [Acidobacteriaceae bacterium]